MRIRPIATPSRPPTFPAKADVHSTTVARAPLITSTNSVPSGIAPWATGSGDSRSGGCAPMRHDDDPILIAIAQIRERVVLDQQHLKAAVDQRGRSLDAAGSTSDRTRADRDPNSIDPSHAGAGISAQADLVAVVNAGHADIRQQQRHGQPARAADRCSTTLAMRAVSCVPSRLNCCCAMAHGTAAR